MTDIQTIVNVSALLASIASLVLAVVAIWLSLHTRKEADRVNEVTRHLLAEIRSDAKIVAQVALPELKAYGESMREFVLHSKAGSEPDQPDGTPVDVANSIVRIQEQLDEMRDVSNVDVFRKRVSDVVSQLKQSEKSMRLIAERESYDGVGIKLNSMSSIVTSSPHESLQDLLAVFLPRGEDPTLTRENYGEVWTLTHPRSGQTIPAKAIASHDTTFDDLKLASGDLLILNIRDQG